MKDYVQYAAVKFVINFSPQDTNATIDSIYIKHTTTLPYSVVPLALKKKPSIFVTTNFVFVLFDRSVVVVSTNQKSIFQERVDLSNPEDKILHINVYENTEKTACSAIIMTLLTGIVQFDIDTAKIQSPDITYIS